MWMECTVCGSEFEVRDRRRAARAHCPDCGEEDRIFEIDSRPSSRRQRAPEPPARSRTARARVPDRERDRDRDRERDRSRERDRDRGRDRDRDRDRGRDRDLDREPEADGVLAPEDRPVILAFQPVTAVEKGAVGATAGIALLVLVFFFMPWFTLTYFEDQELRFSVTQSGLQAAVGQFSSESLATDESGHEELSLLLTPEGEDPNWPPLSLPIFLLPLTSIIVIALCGRTLLGEPRVTLDPFIASALNFGALAIICLYVGTGGVGLHRRQKSMVQVYKTKIAEAKDPMARSRYERLFNKADKGWPAKNHFGLLGTMFCLIFGVVTSSGAIIGAQRRTKPRPGSQRTRGDGGGRRDSRRIPTQSAPRPRAPTRREPLRDRDDRSPTRRRREGSDRGEKPTTGKRRSNTRRDDWRGRDDDDDWDDDPRPRSNTDSRRKRRR